MNSSTSPPIPKLPPPPTSRARTRSLSISSDVDFSPFISPPLAPAAPQQSIPALSISTAASTPERGDLTTSAPLPPHHISLTPRGLSSSGDSSTTSASTTAATSSVKRGSATPPPQFGSSAMKLVGANPLPMSHSNSMNIGPLMGSVRISLARPLSSSSSSVASLTSAPLQMPPPVASSNSVPTAMTTVVASHSTSQHARSATVAVGNKRPSPVVSTVSLSKETPPPPSSSSLTTKTVTKPPPTTTPTPTTAETVKPNPLMKQPIQVQHLPIKPHVTSTTTTTLHTAATQPQQPRPLPSQPKKTTPTTKTPTKVSGVQIMPRATMEELAHRVQSAMPTCGIKCALCGFGFTTVPELEAHIEMEHIKPYLPSSSDGAEGMNTKPGNLRRSISNGDFFGELFGPLAAVDAARASAAAASAIPTVQTLPQQQQQQQHHHPAHIAPKPVKPTAIITSATSKTTIVTPKRSDAVKDNSKQLTPLEELIGRSLPSSPNNQLNPQPKNGDDESARIFGFLGVKRASDVSADSSSSAATTTATTSSHKPHKSKHQMKETSHVLIDLKSPDRVVTVADTDLPPPVLLTPKRVFTFKQPSDAALVIQRMWRGYCVRRWSKPEWHRSKVAHEILESELSYLKSIEDFLTVFAAPLKKGCEAKKPILPAEFVAMVLPQFDPVVAFSHTLLNNLSKRVKKWHIGSVIGDVLAKQIDFEAMFRVYSNYITSYGDVLHVFDRLCTENQKFNKLVETCTLLWSHSHGANTFQSFAILPVQRLPRYGLLVKEMLKWTHDKHPDAANLKAALKSMEDVCSRVNEKQRLKEAERIRVAKLFEIGKRIEPALTNLPATQGRRFLWEEDVQVFDPMKQAPRNRRMFLFTDLLLVTKAKPRKTVQRLMELLTLAGSRVVDIPDEKLLPNTVQLRAKESTILIIFNTPDSKARFIKDITQ